MLEKPKIRDERIVACLYDAYGLRADRIAFLPLGADSHTAVYRVVTDDGTPFFCKLRSGVFDETSVALPRFLTDQGIEQIVAPLVTMAGRLWADLDAYRVILYPFVEGRSGREIPMSDQQWYEFGSALRSIHTSQVPAALAKQIRRETYSPQWREAVGGFLRQVEDDTFTDSVAVRLAVFLRDRRQEIVDLVGRAEELAQILQSRSQAFVLCHSDIHASNVLIDTHGALYIVDWDDPILAPKERDLMFVGGAQGFVGHTPREEEDLFYRGYGSAQVDPVALAYYRYERIVQDIAAYCEQLLGTDDGGQDREQSLVHLISNFEPGDTIEVTYKSDRTWQGAWDT